MSEGGSHGPCAERDTCLKTRTSKPCSSNKALTPAKTWDDLAASHGIRLKKSLGQHFLTDSVITRDIVRLAGVQLGDRVIEIGPGLGILTLELARAGADVLAIETDESLKPALAEVLGEFMPSSVQLVWGNAEDIDWEDFVHKHNGAQDNEIAEPPQWKLVANLPYNIATGLVLDILKSAPQIQTMTVMLQEEVAKRFAAEARSSAYGIPSVKAAFWGDAVVLKQVPPTAFRPPPKVNSAVLQIVRRPPPKIAPEYLFPLVERAFGQRRKMLRRSLRDILSSRIFTAAGVNPESRPEDLDLDAWVRLAQAAPHFDRPQKQPLNSTAAQN